MKSHTLRTLTRDQLTDVCEIIIASALERVDGEEGNPDSHAYIGGALECAGMALASLYAQITDEGMGIQDALALAGDFAHAVGKEWRYDKHNPRTYAKAFVKNCCAENPTFGA